MRGDEGRGRGEEGERERERGRGEVQKRWQEHGRDTFTITSWH